MRVDRQRRVTLHHRAPQRRHGQRQGREHREPDQQPDGRERGDQDERRQRPGLHQRERQVFGILAGAVARLGVVKGVDSLVQEGWDQHRHAHQCVPPGTKAGQRRVLHVGDLVDEAHRPVQREHRDRAGEQGPAGTAHLGRREQRAVADERRAGEVGPVDRRARGGQVPRQLGGGAQHRLVVGHAVCGRGAELCRHAGHGDGGAVEGERCGHGSIHCAQIVAPAWRLQRGTARMFR